MLTDSMLGDTSARTQSAMEELIDELPLGVLFLDEGHGVGRCNPIAQQLLDSPIGAELFATMKKMAGRAATTGHLVEAVISAGPHGELRLLLARAEGVSGFNVYIERSATSRLRAEIQILRALLAAVTTESTPGAAIQPGLASLAGTLSAGWVALFESDPDGKQLKCIAHVNVPPEHETYLLPHAASATSSAVGRAAVVGAPVHLRLLSRAPFPTEQAMMGGEKFAGLALPVRSGEKTLGAIFVCGPVGILGEGEIRLVQGLADAVGALLQRSHSDDSVKREREKRQTLMDNLPDAILESGDTGAIEVAAGRLEILGRPMEALIGASVEDLIAPADRARFRERLRTASHEAAPIAETTVERPDGTRRAVEISLARASPASDRSVRAVFRDVTQRKKLEADVTQAREVAVQRERMALIGQLAAAITHEINNPLAFVRSNVELIESFVPEHLKGSDDARTAMVREALRDSLQGLDRVNSIITALKGMARRNQREAVEFNPETPIREAILIFERAKNGSGRIKLSLPSLPHVTGSPGALAQVLLNLLDNALDASGSQVPPALIEVSACEEAGGVALRVVDRGAGIPDEVRPRLFQAYFTTKEIGKGTGLGLYLSRDILGATGGSIELEDRRDCTSFRVFLPLAT